MNPETPEKIEKDLELNYKLQQKKNNIRKILKERGILPKGAINEYDNYEYFSEAQYKELFTELFSQEGLEWTPSEYQVVEFKGTDKQPFGRRVTMVYHLQDIETGYSEVTYHSGEAIDKGDKALYKAKTGALKAYFASTFLVATKDDPEREEEKPAQKKQVSPKQIQKKIVKGTISPVQDKTIRALFKENKKELSTIMKSLKKIKIEELSREEASEIIKRKRKNKQMNEIIKVVDKKPILNENIVNELLQVEKTLKELKKIEDNYKKVIKEEMEKLNIIKIVDEISGMVINYIPAQKNLEKFHKDELQEERPEIYDLYVTMDGVRASYITVKTK